MARVTQEQAIEQANQQTALEFFEKALESLPDPRRRQGLRYPLRSVVVIALMACVCGCDDAEAMEAWGEANCDWLQSFLDLPHGYPTQDVFLSVFASLDADKFEAVFRSWANFLVARLRSVGKHIAVDGKTSRGSADLANGGLALHTVSAWHSGAGLVLAQRKTDDKSNEITAIPELLKVLDLRGATVTIDAMGCHVEIAQTIVDGGGEYLLPAKDNQPTLRQDIQTTFEQAASERVRTVEELPRPVVENTEEVDKGHHRVERRVVSVCRDLSWLTTAERWPELSFVAQVTRERTDLLTQQTSVETTYYIGSDEKAGAKEIAQLMRGHWGIENGLHWVLDLAFREDEARHRAGNTAENMTKLRRFALNLIKQDKGRKLGVANSRKRAGWDRGYLLELLTGARG